MPFNDCIGTVTDEQNAHKLQVDSCCVYRWLFSGDFFTCLSLRLIRRPIEPFFYLHIHLRLPFFHLGNLTTTRSCSAGTALNLVWAHRSNLQTKSKGAWHSPDILDSSHILCTVILHRHSGHPYGIWDICLAAGSSRWMLTFFLLWQHKVSGWKKVYLDMWQSCFWMRCCAHRNSGRF